MKKNLLTVYILIAMVLGIVVGYIVHIDSGPVFIQEFSDNTRLLTKIFLFLVQMIIAPLVFCTLVVGIAKLGDLKAAIELARYSINDRQNLTNRWLIGLTRRLGHG